MSDAEIKVPEVKAERSDIEIKMSSIRSLGPKVEAIVSRLKEKFRELAGDGELVTFSTEGTDESEVLVVTPRLLEVVHSDPACTKGLKLLRRAVRLHELRMSAGELAKRQRSVPRRPKPAKVRAERARPMVSPESES